MKKLIFSILAIILLIPTLVNADETTCDIDTINSLKEQLKDVTFDLEYVPEGTSLFTELNWGEKNELENLFKLKLINVPSGFQVYLVDGDESFIPIDETLNYVYTIGGVYYLQYKNINCSDDIIKTIEFMIPIYSSNDNDPWFDGTYQQKEKQLDNSKNNVSWGLLVLLIALIIIIISVLIYKRVRSKKYEKN